MYESFCNYQKALLAEFDRLSAEYSFETIDASPDARDVFALLKTRILEVLAGDSRMSFVPKPATEAPKRLIARDMTQTPPIVPDEMTSELELVFKPFGGPAIRQNGNGNGNGHRPAH
jgi:hypothetical protein